MSRPEVTPSPPINSAARSAALTTGGPIHRRQTFGIGAANEYPKSGMSLFWPHEQAAPNHSNAAKPPRTVLTGHRGVILCDDSRQSHCRSFTSPCFRLKTVRPPCSALAEHEDESLFRRGLLPCRLEKRPRSRPCPCVRVLCRWCLLSV